MASAGTVTLELDANSVKLIRELQKAQNQTRRTTGSMQKDFSKAFRDVRKNVTKTTKAILGIATAMTAAATAIFHAQSKMLDELAKTSDALGIQQERLQALQLIADLTGTSANQLSTNLERMQRNIGRVAREGGPASKALDDIGVNIQDIINLKPDEQLEVFARALGEVENQAVKASIAQDLFGRDGVRMLKLMEQLNRDGLQPVVDELQELGIAMTRLDTAKVEAARDELQKAREVSQTTARQFTVGISTAVASLARMFTESRRGAESIAEAVEQIADKVVIGSIRMGASAAQFIEPIKRGAGDVWDAFMSLPTWAKEIGVFGALMFGPKGVAAVALASKALDDTKVTAEWWRAYRDKDIGFFEWFTSGNKEARERLAELERDVTTFGQTPSEEGTDFSLIGALFGSDRQQREDWDRWADGMVENYLNTRREIAQNIEKSVQDAPSISDFVFGDGDDEESIASGLNTIIRQTRTQMERLAEQIKLVETAIEQGVTKPFEEAGTTGEEVLSRLNEQLKQLQDQTGEMNEFAVQAARNMQSAFADFLFNPFENGLKGMLSNFAKTMQRMVAEAASQRILSAIFGGFAGGGGFLGSLGAAFGGVRDQGGRGEPGKAYVINPVAGPEVFIPDSAGTFIPNIDQMGGGVNITIDARDAGAEARIRDMIQREMIPQIVETAKQSTFAQMRRPRFA